MYLNKKVTNKLCFDSGAYSEETVYVVNHEDESYKVTADEASLIEPDTGESVQVTPRAFTLEPKSRSVV